MIDIDLRSRTPIYEQIKEQIMRYIQLGVFRPHEQLPSIRTLSRELNLNINTVKHAFMDLEAYGVIYSLPGKGSYVSENAFANAHIREKALEELRTVILSCQSKGVKQEEVLALTAEIYAKGDMPDD